MNRTGASCQLKASTDGLHRRLDSSPLLAGLILPSLTLERYVVVLEHIAMAWDGCLDLLSPGNGAGLVDAKWVDSEWFALREQLEEDLISLDAPGRPMRQAGRHRLDIDPSNSDQMAGLAYVLNGSRLGAKVIYQKLLAHSDPRIRKATRHFAGVGVRGMDWPGFKRRLDYDLSTPGAIQDACKGAASTYQLWLDVVTAQQLEAGASDRIAAHA